MPPPRSTPLSALHEAHLRALAQGLEAIALPVVVLDLNLKIIAQNAPFRASFVGTAADALIGDACSKLGLARSDPTGEVALVAPWQGEGTISGSRRVRIRPVILDADLEPSWVVMAVERRAARRLSADNLQHRFGLSPRQAEVALLLAQGQTTAEIARGLKLTIHTVRHHAEQVLRRLNVRTRQQALVRLRDGTARGPRARPSGGHARPF